jgi:DNA polymerase III alpha subunit
MAFLTLEDREASMEVVVFSDLFQKKGSLISNDRLLLIRGQISREEGITKMLAREISDLSNVEFSELHLRLSTASHVNKLEELPERARKFPGSIKVKVYIPVEGQVEGAALKETHVTMNTPFEVQVNPDFMAWLEREFGRGSVSLT